MTLAIGMKCKDGLLLAADTRISYDGGAISDAQKITAFSTSDGMFLIAHSSNDANAANSLIAEIKYEIEVFRFQREFSSVEHLIKNGMLKWYIPNHDNRPVIHLLFGACLTEQGEPRIYFCEPPNTVSQVYEPYRAIGDGWAVADSIYKEWFESDTPRQRHASLCQLSYLMYKTKALMPATVGGSTDAAILTDQHDHVPLWITRDSMKLAESFGAMYDRHLADFASIVMSGETRRSDTMLGIAQSIHQSALNYSRLEFHCQFPDKTVRHEYNSL